MTFMLDIYDKWMMEWHLSDWFVWIFQVLLVFIVVSGLFGWLANNTIKGATHFRNWWHRR